ncbi:hypothetical protein CI1B_31510 [Bradyrhizobium ivorense]|uniref:Uncharacterized protein n=1 Tax=Bradyrhizobium ivorense TaxID=2511166 RepID=A0A508TBN5_9BRAD|nr:hypothetical protein CI1B_31510 [Bradyrhizobium ivorense]VIO79169.1 hypothetical protein CI41S_67370 [Bradyrhizobium ivorense]
MIDAAVRRHSRCLPVASAPTGPCIVELTERKLRIYHFVCECVKQPDRFELVAVFANEGGNDVQLQVDAVLQVLYA